MAIKQPSTPKGAGNGGYSEVGTSGVEFAVGSFESGSKEWTQLSTAQTTPVRRNGGDKSELVRVEFDTFKLLLRELTTWGRCTQVDVAEKLFWVDILLLSQCFCIFI